MQRPRSSPARSRHGAAHRRAVRAGSCACGTSRQHRLPCAPPDGEATVTVKLVHTDFEAKSPNRAHCKIPTPTPSAAMRTAR
eukprot:4265023-Prymnesium_polylepis.1